MVCTSVTVVQQKPVVSNLTATASTITQGSITLTWNQDITGDINITVDSTLIVNAVSYPAGSNTAYLSGVAIGTHSVCVAAT